MTRHSGLACVVLVALAGAAHAQSPSAAAAKRFDDGRALMKRGEYAEACAAFEQSQQLEPALGTQFNLAACDAKIGNLAKAWAAFKELGERDTNPERRTAATQLADELAPRLPMLLIKTSATPPGLVVKINGVDVTKLLDTKTPVDLGKVKIEARAPGFVTWRQTAKVTQEGAVIHVEIELERDGEARPRHERRAHASDNPQSDDEGASPAGSRRRTFGIVGVASGGALVVTGLVFGQLANSKWNDAKALCADLMCSTTTDLVRGRQLVADARERATISSVLVIGGAAVIGLGAVLWITAPSSQPTSTAMHVIPSIDREAVGLLLGGRF